MVTQKLRNITALLSELAGSVPPGAWQKLRLLRMELDAVCDVVAGIETQFSVMQQGTDPVVDDWNNRVTTGTVVRVTFPSGATAQSETISLAHMSFGVPSVYVLGCGVVPIETVEILEA